MWMQKVWKEMCGYLAIQAIKMLVNVQTRGCCCGSGISSEAKEVLDEADQNGILELCRQE